MGAVGVLQTVPSLALLAFLIPLLGIWLNRVEDGVFQIETFEFVNLIVGGLFAVIAQERETLLARIEDWRRRWSAIDTPAYLDFYADDFVTNGMNKTAFSSYKRRVNASKHHIDVQLHDLDLMRYPGEPNLIVAQFQQDYRSDNFVVSGLKQQFWRQQKDGSWKIVLEES